jgi:hypothetical protein
MIEEWDVVEILLLSLVLIFCLCPSFSVFKKFRGYAFVTCFQLPSDTNENAYSWQIFRTTRLAFPSLEMVVFICIGVIYMKPCETDDRGSTNVNTINSYKMLLRKESLKVIWREIKAHVCGKDFPKAVKNLSSNSCVIQDTNSYSSKLLCHKAKEKGNVIKTPSF